MTENQPTTMYVLTQGEYSDMEIVGVVSSLEAAQAISDRWGSRRSYCSIVIHPFILDEVTARAIRYTTSIYLDTGESRREAPEPIWNTAGGSEFWSTMFLEYGSNRECVPGWGATPEAAIKSAQDHRTRLLAERAGLT